MSEQTMELTKPQRRALRLLADQGGVRYGTQIEVMKELKGMGLCYAHDKGERPRDGTRGSREQLGRWVWRPTSKGVALARVLATQSQEKAQ